MTNRSCKLVVLGDSGVGKTTLINSYVNHEFCASFKATIGADFSSKQVTVGNDTVELCIWDTAGEERFHSIGSTFYRGADACLLVYDLTQRDSLNRLEYWMDDIVQKSGISNQDEFPFIVFGNKSDLVESRQIDPEAASKWVEAKGWPHFMVSAKTSLNLDEGFQKIVEVYLSIPLSPTPIDDSQRKKACNC